MESDFSLNEWTKVYDLIYRALRLYSEENTYSDIENIINANIK